MVVSKISPLNQDNPIKLAFRPNYGNKTMKQSLLAVPVT